MRCFIAAWPTNDTRAALYRLAVELKDRVERGRPMQARNIHLTLAFIGELDAAKSTDLARACRKLSSDIFEWSIDTVGSFARARVVWAGGPVGQPLADTVARARNLLDSVGIAYDRRPFVPHVTLFRDVRHFEAGGRVEPPLRWATEHIALYAADRDAHGPLYRRISIDES
jgi:2'-5' RNA ligase